MKAACKYLSDFELLSLLGRSISDKQRNDLSISDVEVTLHMVKKVVQKNLDQKELKLVLNELIDLVTNFSFQR